MRSVANHALRILMLLSGTCWIAACTPKESPTINPPAGPPCSSLVNKGEGFSEYETAAGFRIRIPDTVPSSGGSIDQNSCKLRMVGLSYQWEDGRLMPVREVERSFDPVRDAGKFVTLYVGIATPVEAKKNRERAVKESWKYETPIRLDRYPMVLYPHWTASDDPSASPSDSTVILVPAFGVLGVDREAGHYPLLWCNKPIKLDVAADFQLPKDHRCRGQISFDERGAGAMIDIEGALLPEADKVFSAAIATLQSYVVKE